MVAVVFKNLQILVNLFATKAKNALYTAIRFGHFSGKVFQTENGLIYFFSVIKSYETIQIN